MPMIFFSAIQPSGQFSDRGYGGPSIENCLDVMNQLVDAGWQLIKLDLVDIDQTRISLPVDAFTGRSMQVELTQMEKARTVRLNHHGYFTQAYAKNRFSRRVIHDSIQKQEQIRKSQLVTTQQIKALYAKMDRVQARIQQTKAQWNVM